MKLTNGGKDKVGRQVWLCTDVRTGRKVRITRQHFVAPTCRDAYIARFADDNSLLPRYFDTLAEAREFFSPECLGHESTNGPIGNVVYCDGSCRAHAR